MASVWGKNIKISIFGESHGHSVGVVIDNFPAGITYDEEFINLFLARRRAKKKSYSTSRIELDIPKIVSGVFEGKTTGTPICAIFENSNTKSGDYSNLINHPRPSHADFSGRARYNGFNDMRGGGHFSGRLTLPIAFAGALCKLFLRTVNVDCAAHIYSIGHINDEPLDMHNPDFSFLDALSESGLTLIDHAKDVPIMSLLDAIRLENDSIGGVVEGAITGLPIGIGSPIFDNVESTISSMLFSVPAVKGVEFGTGFDIALMRGSQANDRMKSSCDGNAEYFSNNNGGLTGGITNGAPIIVRAAFKPTPSISKSQDTFNVNENEINTLEIHGRHDPCVVPRAVPVVEAALALCATDLYLEAYGYEFPCKFKK